MKKILASAAVLALAGHASAQTEVSGTINAASPLSLRQWTVAGSPYILQGIVYVEGTVLDIEPGVVVRGQPRTDTSTFDPGALVIRPDAQIQARGTFQNPIIFTTAAIDGGLAAGGARSGVAKNTNGDQIADRWTPADGLTRFLDQNPASTPLPALNPNSAKNANLWGGLVVAGRSLTNNGGQVNADAVSGFVGDGTSALDDGFGLIEGIADVTKSIYGGTNSEDNSGIIRYVSIRHGGAELISGRELNGLTLYAVGSKTTVSHVDVYSTGDDGVEIFGGTVNVKNLNINYADDDGFDVDEGWQGVAQYVFVLQGLGYGDSGFELDGEDKNEGHASTPIFPVGDGRIYNATVIVARGDNAGGSRGIRMRAGYAGQIVNSIVHNIGTSGGTGIVLEALSSGDTTPSAAQQFGSPLWRLQVRNNSVSGFGTNYSLAAPETAHGTTLGATGAVGGTLPASYIYPAVSNNTVTPAYATISHTSAGGINPRPGSTSSGILSNSQAEAYVFTPAEVVGFRGAFSKDSANLWTTGWTALNLRGILTN